MTVADIDLTCRDLRTQHETMTEEEKKRRSALHFFVAQKIVTALETSGTAITRLVDMNTGLTKVLSMFLDFESLRDRKFKQKREDLYHRSEADRDAGISRFAQDPRNDGHCKVRERFSTILLLTTCRPLDGRIIRFLRHSRDCKYFFSGNGSISAAAPRG